jgi:hypothetical protein
MKTPLSTPPRLSRHIDAVLALEIDEAQSESVVTLPSELGVQPANSALLINEAPFA